MILTSKELDEIIKDIPTYELSSERMGLDVVKKLLSMISEMKECLEFYADDKNWDDCFYCLYSFNGDKGKARDLLRMME